MTHGVVINTEVQKQRMISLLEKCIEEDCIQGRKFLTEKLREQPDALPPHILKTIEKNLEVREAVYRNVIEDMRIETDFPVALPQIFGRFLSAFSRSLPDSDPAKEDYMPLVSHLIPAARVPAAMRNAVMPNVPEGMVFRGALALSPEKATLENIQCIEYRQMTIDTAMHRVFDSFYQAATSQSREDMKDDNRLYRRFCERIDQLLRGAAPSR